MCLTIGRSHEKLSILGLDKAELLPRAMNPGGRARTNAAGTLVARSNFEESLRSAPPPTRYLDVDTALDIYRSRFYGITTIKKYFDLTKIRDQVFKARLLENVEERDSLQGSPSEFGRDVKVPVEYRSDRLGIPLTGGPDGRDSVGCKVGGVVSIRDKDEIGAFLSTQVIRPPYDLAPLAYLFDELFFSVPRMRISLQCPSLELNYNGRRVSRKEQRTAVTAVAVAVAIAVAIAVASMAAATTTLCALINRLRYRKTYFRR
ncbi:hypothetical protein V1477_010038 [Vespula maculifrons]|uniref:Uncharacterized protein n=1 Tax=Vespula maculifrons TaxID=7453 RepID=A0ABD2CCC4_VESMC